MRKLETVPKPGHLAAEVPINILYVVRPDPKDLSRDVVPWDTFPSRLAAEAASETALLLAASAVLEARPLRVQRAAYGAIITTRWERARTRRNDNIGITA
jgi:hypothetical protein